MTDHVADDDLVALALDEVQPGERTVLSAHLSTCERCRGEYDAVAHSVQSAMAATPSIAPPPGFSGRVLAAMGLEPTEETAVRSHREVTAPHRAQGASSPAPRRRSTQLVAAAAALVVGVGVGVTGTLALVARPDAPVSSAPGQPTSAVALLTRAGDPVGTAGLTVMGGQSYLVVTVTRGRPGVAYDCVTVGKDGRRTTVGTWTLEDKGGGSQASGTWLVPVPAGSIDRIELVTTSGTVWSAAEL